jgi:hypothetical protein
VQCSVTARAVDFLDGEKIVTEQPAIIAARLIDDDDVRRQARNAGQALPVQVDLETNLVGKGRTLLHAARDPSTGR